MLFSHSPFRRRPSESRDYSTQTEQPTILIGWDPMKSGFAGRSRSSAQALGHPSLATRSQRALYAFAIFTVFVASAYSGLALLSRVTPALFPGRALTNVGVVQIIDNVAPVPQASETGSFRDPIRVLILGTDRRPWEVESASLRTDVIMVASLDPGSKRTTFLSFPRDLAIRIHNKDDSSFRTRINESYGIGLDEGGNRAAGIDQLKRDLKGNFGIEVDHYVILDFHAVEELVDAVGGITVDIPEDLEVGKWWYSNDDKDHRLLSFPAGRTTMDGYHAVAFGRNRDGSDLYRIKRQQLVMRAALQKGFSSGVIGRNPFELWDAYNSLVKTDVPRSAMPGLADLMKKTGGTAEAYSLGDPVDEVPTVIEGYLPGGAAVLFWEPENVQYWLSRAFPVTRHADVIVELQNAYGDQSLGSSRISALGRYLKYSKGLATVYYGDDQPQSAQTKVLLRRESQRKAAEEIAGWLGLPKSRVIYEPVSSRDTLAPDITVVVGRDFVIPTTRVDDPLTRSANP